MRNTVRLMAPILAVAFISTLIVTSRVNVRGDAGGQQPKAKPTPVPTPPPTPVAGVYVGSGTPQSAISVCCSPGGWTLVLTPSTGIVSDHWETSPGPPSAQNWTAIPGATGITANVNPDPSLCTTCVNAPVTVLYRAIYTNSFVSGISNVVSVTVFPEPQGGPLTASPQTICSGGTSAISLGGCVVGSVVWSSQVGGTGPFVPLNPQPSGNSFVAGPLTQSTCYQATITSGPCPPLVLTVCVTVVQPPVAGTISASHSTICAGQATTLTLTGATGNIQWFVSTAPVLFPHPNCCPSFVPIAGATNNTTLNTNILSRTTCFEVQVSDPSGVCPPVMSAPVTVTVNQPPTAPTISGPAYICPGGSAIVHMTPGPTPIPPCFPTPAITYQLFNLSDPLAPGVAILPFGSATVTAPGNYQVEAKNSCGKVFSNIITIRLDTLSVKITGPCCDCKGAPVTLTATPTGGVAPYSYAWSNGATSPSIHVSPTVTTTYTVTVTDANGCKATACFTVTVCN